MQEKTPAHPRRLPEEDLREKEFLSWERSRQAATAPQILGCTEPCRSGTVHLLTACLVKPAVWRFRRKVFWHNPRCIGACSCFFQKPLPKPLPNRLIRQRRRWQVQVFQNDFFLESTKRSAQALKSQSV